MDAGIFRWVSGVVAAEPTPLSPQWAGADPESSLSHQEETMASCLQKKKEFQAKPKAGETDSPGVTQVSALPRAVVHL